MDIRVLTYFLEVASEGNITKAANSLSVTQPTLSRQLMQLEDELGVRLFERGNHNISLTEEGYLFRRRAQEIVNLTEKARLELLQNEDELAGNISIGCSETQSMSELSDLISDFRAVHPRVTFDIRSGNNEEVKEWLDQGNIDAGLVIETIDTSGVSYIRFKKKDKWGILVHKNSSRASKTGIKATDLVNVPLITIMDETIHKKLGNWSGEYARMMVPIVHYNLLSNVATMVRENSGVAICAEPGSHYDNLLFIPFEPRLELGAYLICKDNQKLSKVTSSFLHFACNAKNE